MQKKFILFGIFIFLGVLQALIFMFAYARYFTDYSSLQCLLAVLCSVPQALMVSAWVMTIPFLVGFFYVWIRGDWHRRFMIHYVTLAVLGATFITVTDWVLFGFWGIRLDSTPLIYLLDSPLQAMGESPWWSFPLTALSLVVLYILVKSFLKHFYPARRSGSITSMKTGSAQQVEALLNLACFILMIILGNGCFGLMGMKSAFFSSHEPLNNAAINPIYSIFHSYRHGNLPLSEQYRFMTEEERQSAMQELANLNVMNEAQLTDSCFLLDSVKFQSPLRQGITPNVLVIMLEGFSGSACTYLNPQADSTIMPCVNQAMAEGVAFTRFYANSFRTERALTSVLASFPGQPTRSIITESSRCDQLSYLTQPLAEAGYSLEFLHGGNADYCNIPYFLTCAGIDSLRQTDARRLPSEMHNCKEGVDDASMYNHLAHLLREEAKSLIDTLAEYPAQPYFKIFPTISSHEPFDVPDRRFENDYLNSVAYADSCLGAFLSEIRQDTTIWNNLLVIALADHCYAVYPEDIQQRDPERYHIPMFWTGGAIAQHCDVDILCQQTDLAATLFSILGIQADALPYSHDIFSPSAPHFAFYAWPDGFGFLADDCQYIQSNPRDGHPLDGTNDPDGRAQRLGRAYLQTIYNDLAQQK